ncbi:MAG: methyltransferase [Acidimicrobiales bacterium]
MIVDPVQRAALVDRLAAAGCVAAEQEADELLVAAASPAELDAFAARRADGEPLPWIVRHATFAGLRIRSDVGVYVPRPQSELVARAALALLPDRGIAYDVATGSGAIAALLAAHRPGAAVIGLDLDPRAVACARGNGVDARVSDLLAELEPTHAGRVDVVVAVPPYVPTPHLPLLARDTLAFEDARWYDGGPEGIDVLARLAAQAGRALAPDGALVVELGADQAGLVAPALHRAGLAVDRVLADEEGDVRGLVAVRSPRSGALGEPQVG